MVSFHIKTHLLKLMEQKKKEKYVPKEDIEPLPKPDLKNIKEVVPKSKTFKGKLKYSDYNNENFKLKKLKSDNTIADENVRSTGELDVTPAESDALDNGLTIKNVTKELPDYVTDDPDFIEFYNRYRTADEKTKTKMLSDKLKSLGKEDKIANNTIRVSLDYSNTLEEIDIFISTLERIIGEIR